MKVLKNVKAWKTTTIGLILIAAAIASIFMKVGTWVEVTIPVCVGIVLLFSPDNILQVIKKIIDK
jgi:hypothetical protein